MKRAGPLQKYLLTFLFAIIGIFSTVYVLMFIMMFNYNDQYSRNIDNYFMYNNLMNEINRVSVVFDIYLRNPTDAELNNYLIRIDNAKSVALDLRNSTDNETIYTSLVAIENLIASYAEKNMEIIENMSKAAYDIERAINISQIKYRYIIIRISDTMGRQAELSRDIFNQMSMNFRAITILTVSVLISVVVVLTIVIIKFSRRISAPMIQLSAYAKQISTGGFDFEDLAPTGPLELNELAESLNKMKAGLGNMFDELAKNARLEADLHERELENLRIISELQNTELKVLQAQINPHFLFNTLNSINRMAFMNDNQEIVKIIEALSEMLRYSINEISGPITLRDEIANLKRYIYIQQVRFKDKLDIEINVDSCRLDMKLPCMILQPLVENAIIHGLRPYDYSGDISVNIFDTDKATIAIIADTGVGIKSARLQEMKGKPENWMSKESDTQSTGIGLSNVLMRLQNYFGDDDCTNIESVEGEGTTITLVFPAPNGDNG